MKLSFISLGCPKNTVDSEKILNRFFKKGLQFVSNPEKADAVIINTCGFIKPALDECHDVLEEMLELKKNIDGFQVVLLGCAVKRYPDFWEKNYPNLDGAFSLGQEKELIDFLTKNIPFDEKIPEKKNQIFREIGITLPHYAYLKIGEGCNRHCAFCSIPFIRGKYKSRPVEDIIKEARFLVKRGAKELILIAQDTTYYGKDLYKKTMLLPLLKKLEQIKDLQWIRILYAYPENLTTELLAYWCDSKKILPYLDLPIQHSHPDLLKKMGRGGSFKKFDSIFKYVKEKKPEFCLRTTIITGFPGEKKEYFEHLLNYVQTMQFDRLGVFQYQNEPGTKAYDFKGQVSAKIKQKRFEKLMTAQQVIHFKKNSCLEGRIFNVIIDHGLGKGQYAGRCYRDAPEIDTMIYFKTKHDISVGNIVKIKITSSENYDLKGKLV